MGAKQNSLRGTEDEHNGKMNTTGRGSKAGEQKQQEHPGVRDSEWSTQAGGQDGPGTGGWVIGSIIFVNTQLTKN